MIINFSKKIYKKPAILKAVKEFASLADFEVNENKNYYIATIQNIDSDFKNSLKDEFCNYILFLNF